MDIPFKQIDAFGSQGFTHHRAARGETFQVAFAELDGVIGGHDAVSEQLLVVLSGRVRCSTRDAAVELARGEAVRWGEGEWHETRSLEPSLLLIVEGAFE